MIASMAARPALRRQIALIAALALLFSSIPALAAPSVRVTLRSAITLGMAPHNHTAALSATVKTSDGSTPEVRWSSRGAAVSVDAQGNVTAQKYGTAYVYAAAGGATARCVVTVRRLPVRALTPSKKKVTLLSMRDGIQLTARPTPANADNPNVTWSSSKPSVARVDALTGYVTPLKPGVARIQCRAADGTKKKAYCTVVVKPVRPAALALSAERLEVNVGAAASLTATIAPADATDQRIAWSSSNPSVASVKNGAITGRKFGKTTISARTRTGSIVRRCVVDVGYFDTTFRALVIGQSIYDYPVSSLNGPQNDAGMVKSMLTNADFGGGKNVNVTLQNNLTAAGIRSALGRMASWGADSDDVTYFYYSGHGDINGSLVGVDGNTVTVEEVRGYLDRLPGTVVVMIDSCYAGWFIRGKSAPFAVGASPADPDAITRRMVSAFSTASAAPAAKSAAPESAAKPTYRILVSSASTEESYIYPFRDYSLFTYHLAAGGGVQPANWEMALKMAADANRNNIVTLNELFKYTKAKVGANGALKRAKIKQSVRVSPAGSAFPVVQRTP